MKPSLRARLYARYLPLSFRQWLLLASFLLILGVSGSVLAVTYFNTTRLVQEQASPLMRAAQNEARARLHLLFNTVRQQLLKDCGNLALGGVDPEDKDSLRRLLQPTLQAVPSVGSLMVADLEGWQYLMIRYTEAVRDSPLLAEVRAQLPDPKTKERYVTREFRLGENAARWSFLDPGLREESFALTLPMHGYDPRKRPWFEAAKRSLAYDGGNGGAPTVSWTTVNTLFTTKAPGISAAATARAPSGQLLLIVYDLLLNDIARFCSETLPTEGGFVAVFDEQGKMHASPSGIKTSPEELERSEDHSVILHRSWKETCGAKEGQYSLQSRGVEWVTRFESYRLDDLHQLWVLVALPEADLAPLTRKSQTTVVYIGIFAFVLAGLAAAWSSRRISLPIAQLAERSRSIANLDLRAQGDVRVKIRELHQLSRALETMRLSLLAHIEERDEALTHLRERERELRDLAENSRDAIVRVDRQFRYQYVNPAFSRATGFSQDLVTGRKIEEIPLPNDLEGRIRKEGQRVIDTCQDSLLFFEYPTQRGLRVFECCVSPEFAESGEVESLLFISRDITDRVEAEKALRQSEKRFRKLIETPIGGIVVFRGQDLLFANQEAARLFDYSDLGKMLAQPFDWDQMCPGAIEPLSVRIAAQARQAGQSLPLEWSLQLADGSRRWLQAQFTEVEWEGSLAIQGFVYDTTREQEAAARQTHLEDQLRQSQKMEAVGLLAGGIAHDLNNVLQVIGGNAALALYHTGAVRERERYLEEIVQAVAKAAGMIQQLLTFSRRQPLQRKAIDLKDLVSEQLTFLRRLLPANIEIVFEKPKRPLIVLADRNQMSQVLMNLCVNARDAMPNGGRIVIEASAEEVPQGPRETGKPQARTCARLCVTDTGTGMDAATLQRIFEPFFTTKPREKGTGLGLSVVFGIIQQHEGEINVQSEPGQGTAFSILLPLHAAPLPPPPPAAKPVESAALKAKARILLAEDSEAVMQVAHQVLKRAGYQVHCVPDGLKAAETFANNPNAFDLLFFDVVMPGLDGLRAAQRCLEVKPGTPVVFASGYSADTITDPSLLPDGSFVLQKPYVTEQLLQAIQQGLKPQKTVG